ncbi:MAG: YHYH protein [Candidatus Didemnitutus sp.]|nr:YHYH protein [Candidatus Didemnitutus sp.]
MTAVPRCLALLCLLTASLAAHPDHTATQKSDVRLLPAKFSSPGTSTVSIKIVGNNRVVTANGLPDHDTVRFPNRDNPNPIREQRYRYTMPAAPKANDQPTPLVRQPFGVALNGVLFDPSTAAYWQEDRNSGWHYEAKGNAFSLGLDVNNAHVQPNGAYHYHGIPTALLKRLSGDKPQLTLVGWAADGFPIYAAWGHRVADDATSEVVRLRSSYQLKPGPRPGTDGQPDGVHDGIFEEDFVFVAGSGDLDECGGRVGVTPEFPNGTYYYVLTDDFPFVPRAFRGTPDPSFVQRHGRDSSDAPRRRRG